MSDPNCKYFDEWSLKCHRGNVEKICRTFATGMACAAWENPKAKNVTDSEILTKIDTGRREDQAYIKTASTPASAMEGQVGGNHYKNMKIQPAEFCQKNNIAWCEANAIKYACRHKTKNGIEDLKKAIHYLRLCAKLEYNEEI